MNNKEQALRNLALKLNVSGTAEVLDEQKLYKNSYGFIKLQAYAPLTQNTAAPVCTVFCTTRDEFGVQKISTNNYGLLYVKDITLDGQGYSLFECYLPKEFTEKTTPPDGLKLTINYYDTAPTLDEQGNPVLNENGNPMRHTTNLLVSSQYITTVYPGGWNNQDINLGINSSESAQINQNTRDIAGLITDVTGLRNYIDDFYANFTDAIDATNERIDELEDEVESIKNLGHHAGTFDNYQTPQAQGNTTVPLNRSAFPQGLTVNDFVGVRADETHGGLATRYVVDAIASDGTVTWEYDITYATDITGKMDNRPTATENNFVAFDELGNSKDSGLSGATIQAAQTSADEAKQIALQRDSSKVFDTVAQMNAWLSVPENVASLSIGSSLFIIDENSPDYWWTGTEALPAGEKIDLTVYYTKEQIDQMLAAMRAELVATFSLDKSVITPDYSAQRIVTLPKAEFTALPYKDPNTLYIIPDDEIGNENDIVSRLEILERQVADLMAAVFGTGGNG